MEQSMATPPIRLHPARWLLERPELSSRARLRDRRDDTERNLSYIPKNIMSLVWG
jgi:hypothetical protein